MQGKARVALVALAVLAAMGGPASATFDRFALQHRTLRHTGEFIGVGTCSLEISWSKEPSAEKTEALQLAGKISCPASLVYDAHFTLYEELLPPTPGNKKGVLSIGVRDADRRGATGDVSFSIRFQHTKSLQKYVLELDLRHWDPILADDPSGICQNEGEGSERDALCRLQDVIWVKRGNDQLGRMVRLLPI
jgi:hypothetical protein